MKHSHRVAAAALLCGLSAAASAHPGHGAPIDLLAGLAHPFGADHLLAALAVGVWASAALPAGRRLAGPLVFLLALLGGALAGMSMPSTPLLETGVAASVAVLGAMLLAPRALPRPMALVMIAGAALLHGAGHGSAWTAGSFAGYAAGFMATTALLHLAGLAAGGSLLKAQRWLWHATAAACTLSGVWMLATL
ncbi:MAG TPA: HupE/UreJ family protein [Albitalea sp.]|nr:HupE/UreJ family protein [Albitalea sp.]